MHFCGIIGQINSFKLTPYIIFFSNGVTFFLTLSSRKIIKEIGDEIREYQNSTQYFTSTPSCYGSSSHRFSPRVSVSRRARYLRDMGSSFSNLNGVSNGFASGPTLGDIPENCIACVILHLDLAPPEICNLARLNRAFRGAASSDAVWERKLPSNYQNLLDLLPSERYQSLSKKNIFALLSRPIPFDDGNKELWIDKLTGGVCMAISARAMAITGIEDRRYWNWFATEESRFHVVAYLQQIWWFEVDGIVRFNLPPGKYCLSFKIHLGRFSKKMGRRVCHFEHTHGWELKPVRFSLSTSEGQEASCEYYLTDKDGEAMGRGLWREYKVGEFVVSCSQPSTEVQWSMKQIDCTHSKGGICVDSVFIIPIDVKQRKKQKATVNK